MRISNVGLMTPGDMGQALAQQIAAKGFTVHTALDRRSERSRALARAAGFPPPAIFRPKAHRPGYRRAGRRNPSDR